MLRVSLARQSLRAELPGMVADYPISTALAGPGEQRDSGCTPRGRHRVRALIGAGQPAGAVFIGRRPTGEIYTPALGAAHPERDWILSRILWLGGLEPGRNRYGRVDSQTRYIYIHGTNEEARLGEPVSHGCIRMANADVIALFAHVAPNTEVWIDD